MCVHKHTHTHSVEYYHRNFSLIFLLLYKTTDYERWESNYYVGSYIGKFLEVSFTLSISTDSSDKKSLTMCLNGFLKVIEKN